jgi:hypothetical protein
VTQEAGLTGHKKHNDGGITAGSLFPTAIFAQRFSRSTSVFPHSASASA